MKQEGQEVEQKTKTCEKNRHRFDNVIALACTNFVDEGITMDMFPEDKVIRIGEIVEDLHQKITELEEKIKPSTPPQVLE